MNLLLESGLKIGARVGPDDARASRGWDALHVAAALNRTDEVVELVRMMRGRGSLDRGDRKGRTPLHVAAGKGNIRCAKVLVESGANKDARSRDGRTALHRAAVTGDRPMVEMLMEMGADPTIPNERGRLPVDVARGKGHVSRYETRLFVCLSLNIRINFMNTLSISYSILFYFLNYQNYLLCSLIYIKLFNMSFLFNFVSISVLG